MSFARLQVEGWLAPFTFGCLTPRHAESIQILGEESNSLVVRLRRMKDEQMGAAVEATVSKRFRLTMGGTAPAHGRWEIAPSTVPEWIRPHQMNGTIDSSQTEVVSAMNLSTDGQPEQEQPYEASVAVHVYTEERSDTLRIPGVSHPERLDSALSPFGTSTFARPLS